MSMKQFANPHTSRSVRIYKSFLVTTYEKLFFSPRKNPHTFRSVRIYKSFFATTYEKLFFSLWKNIRSLSFFLRFLLNNDQNY
jgi:hypothetical protein